MSECHSCGLAVEILLDFGKQPLSNRLLSDRSHDTLEHALVLSQCHDCGLIQMADPVPPVVLKPPVDVQYNEPERHLDQMTDVLCGLPGVSRDTSFCGLTYKDASLVERLRARGYPRTVCLDAAQAFGPDCTSGMETIQQFVSEGGLAGPSARNEKQDVLIARHILEHAHHLPAFIAGLAHMLHSESRVVLEVPDFTNSLTNADYSTIWEEHIAYFTPKTLKNTLRYSGMEVEHSCCYPYSLENSIVMVARPGAASVDVLKMFGDARAEELTRARKYAVMYPTVRQKWAEYLAALRAEGKKAALLGVGHLAITFINALGLADGISFAADDDPSKRNRLLPGSRLPVYSSDELYTHSVAVCLLGVPPESEHKVLKRHNRFIEKGGKFVSIFPDSALALDDLPRQVG